MIAHIIWLDVRVCIPPWRQAIETYQALDEQFKTARTLSDITAMTKSETAASLNLYVRRLLSRLTRLYNLLNHMQAKRLGEQCLARWILSVKRDRRRGA
jgi:hypothetical protein